MCKDDIITSSETVLVDLKARLGGSKKQTKGALKEDQNNNSNFHLNMRILEHRLVRLDVHF